MMERESALASMGEDRMDEDHRLITEAGARAIYERVQQLAEGGGTVSVSISGWWRGSLRWARNRVSLASDRRDIIVHIRRMDKYYDGTRLDGGATLNQIDDASIVAGLRYAERNLRRESVGPGSVLERRSSHPPLPYPDTPVWSDATYRVMPEQRTKLAQTLIEGAEHHQMLSAGEITMRIHERQNFGYNHIDSTWMPSDEPPEGSGASRTARSVGYLRHTEAACSMTVRHPKGLGSGWAGLSSYDWSSINSEMLAQRALDKCLSSLNPVAIEPGRYTVILEPQAVNVFVERLLRPLGRPTNENVRLPGVYSLDVDPSLGMRMTKLGLQIIDERISISSDPMDPRLGQIPSLGLGPVTWFEHGVLKVLAHDRDRYAIPELRENLPAVGTGAFLMTGGTATIEEMITTTKRGVLVSRFSGVSDINTGNGSLLMTGLTRDGLWLIENGKISKAVKNMRFTDSPLFVFNQVEQLGVPMPVFLPSNDMLRPRMVPPLKSRDFAFTATVDAV